MTELEAMLRAWGRYFGERPPKEWDETEGDESSLTPNHPIARAMEYAGGESGIVGRAARSAKRIRGVPTWGFDPVRATETRSFRISVPEDVPDVVRRVQAAALQLSKMDHTRGTVLRFEYCRRGRQADKTVMLAEIGIAISLRTYREQLASAKGWMEGRLFGAEW